MQQLDPRSVWLFFLSTISVWGIFLTIVLLQFIFAVALGSGSLLNAIPFFTLMFIIVVIIISFIWAELSYKFYKYQLTEDGFRKEHGVIWKKYVTIPYDRIQNVDIYRGVFARILGLSDLHIQTAGMGSAGSGLGGKSEGRLPGLSIQVAEQLRDELIRRAKSPNQGHGI